MAALSNTRSRRTIHLISHISSYTFSTDALPLRNYLPFRNVSHTQRYLRLSSPVQRRLRSYGNGPGKCHTKRHHKARSSVVRTMRPNKGEKSIFNFKFSFSINFRFQLRKREIVQVSIINSINQLRGIP